MSVEQESNENKYLVFQIGDGTYATPLLDVAEVIEAQDFRSVPNSADFVMGVMNLRGAIIPLVDIRRLFRLPAQDPKIKTRIAYLLFDTSMGKLSCSVDQVMAVKDIPLEDIDVKPKVHPFFAQKYLLGIAKLKDELVTVVKLSDLLSETDLVRLTDSKFA
jgi:purine-binding chemotaxis protein CheW